MICAEGPAAAGKSRLVGEFAAKLAAEMGAALLQVESGSEFARADSAGMQALAKAVKDSAEGIKTVVVIDESHSIPLRPFATGPGPSTRFFNSLLYGSGQGWKRRGSLEFAGEEISFDTSNLQIICMTNHPERIGGGKNADAILRRFYRIALSRYTDAEMRKVIPHFFSEKGRTVETKAANFLSKMHRGTLEALGEFMKILPHSGEITLDMVKEFLPNCRFQSRGFTKDEIRVCHWLATTAEPRTKDSIALRFEKLDIGEFFRHAARQTSLVANASGEKIMSVTPFIYLNARKEYTLSDMGLAWLKNVAPLISTWD